MVRQSKNSNKDNVETPCIHGKDRNSNVNLKDKMEVWKKYKKQLNVENEWGVKHKL